MIEGLGIDIDAFRHMQEEDLRVLVPDHRLGVRIKLRQRVKEWKERKVCCQLKFLLKRESTHLF